jgi:hypothetical protein
MLKNRNVPVAPETSKMLTCFALAKYKKLEHLAIVAWV